MGNTYTVEEWVEFFSEITNKTEREWVRRLGTEDYVEAIACMTSLKADGAKMVKLTWR